MRTSPNIGPGDKIPKIHPCVKRYRQNALLIGILLGVVAGLTVIVLAQQFGLF